MSENRIQKEPSTEEILGSIRRIITEDNAQADEAGASGIVQTETIELPVFTDDIEADEEMMAVQPTATELPVFTDDIEADEEVTAVQTAATEFPALPDDVEADELATTEVTPVDAVPGEFMPAEMATDDEDILELTDEVAEAEWILDTPPVAGGQPEEIRREPRFGFSATPSYETDFGEDDGIQHEPAVGAQAGESPQAEQQPQDNTGWTSGAAEPLAGYNYSAQVLSSNQNPADDQDMAGQEDYAMASTTDGEPEAPETPETEETAQSAADFGGAEEGIVSQTAGMATSAAFGDLNRAMSEKTDRLKVGADTTVSDIVKEMLRPMLREWLDENLPQIVDRSVRREIQKLVDRAQDDV